MTTYETLKQIIEERPEDCRVSTTGVRFIVKVGGLPVEFWIGDSPRFFKPFECSGCNSVPKASMTSREWRKLWRDCRKWSRTHALDQYLDPKPLAPAPPS